jgi:hypothetical protein
MVRNVKLANSLNRPTVTFSSTFTKEATTALVKGIKILLQCDGYVVHGHEREQSSIDNIVDLLSPLSPKDLVSAVKYLTAVYLPMLLGDELPPKPDFLSPEATLFTGEYGRYIKRLFATSNGQVRASRRSLSLATSILQLKRYLPPLPRVLQLEAIRDCKKRLTVERSTDPQILSHIRVVTQQLFPVGWDNGGIPKYSVTNKSCFESSRAEGGAQAFMFNPNHPVHLPKPLMKKQKSTLELIRSAIKRLEGKEEVVCPRKNLIEVPILPSQYELERMDGHRMELRRHPLAPTRQEYLDAALATQPEQLESKMEIVEDPLKARVITKNNWQCTILKPLQKMIHSHMRKDPRFELMGKQIDADVISALPLFSGAKWVSGDYAAATDNLNADVTETILDEILVNMTGRLSRLPEFISLAARSLTNLTIFHEEVGYFTQTNGQLMGSLLSFPVLCIANYAMWHKTAQEHYQLWPSGLGEHGKWDNVRINGDDIAFASDPKMYEKWKVNVVRVGLEPSMGKNYYSDRLVMLNSRPFLPQTQEDGSVRMTELKWLNLGLLKSPADEESDNVESLGPMHDDFVRNAEDKRMASGIFIQEQQGMLRTTFRNLFGPRCWGGLGGHPVTGTKGADAEAYDVRQLYVAKLLKEGKIKLPSSGASRTYSQYIERYVKLRFPNVVQGQLSLLPDAPEGFRWEDVSARVDECRLELESATAWLGPLLVTRRARKDHSFLRSLMRQVDGKKIEGMPWDEYNSFEEDTALYQLMQDVPDLSFTLSEDVASVS